MGGQETARTATLFQSVKDKEKAQVKDVMFYKDTSFNFFFVARLAGVRFVLMMIRRTLMRNKSEVNTYMMKSSKNSLYMAMI